MCLLTSCNHEQKLFWNLQEARRETDRARPFAEELSKTPEGTRLALEDMDVFGGSTRGWSSWILIESSLATEIEPKLKEIISDQSIDPSKRIEAAHIMWARTKDTIYLEKMFAMVRGPGDQATEWGRRKLATSIESEEMAKRLMLPPTEPIQLKDDDFHSLIKDPQNLRMPK